MSIFGQMLDGAQVEETVESFLKRWLPTYLAQIAEDRGLARNAIAPPVSWQNTPEFTLTESTQLPAILVITAGISGQPVRHGDGSYSATWIVGIGVVVTAGGPDPARATSRLAKRYGAAIRTLMLQHASLESSNVEGVTWEDENYDDIPTDQRRSLASARLVFSIEFRDVLNALDGPLLPANPPADSTAPYADWSTIPDIGHVYVTAKRSK